MTPFPDVLRYQIKMNINDAAVNSAWQRGHYKVRLISFIMGSYQTRGKTDKLVRNERHNMCKPRACAGVENVWVKESAAVTHHLSSKYCVSPLYRGSPLHLQWWPWPDNLITWLASHLLTHRLGRVITFTLISITSSFLDIILLDNIKFINLPIWGLREAIKKKK